MSQQTQAEYFLRLEQRAWENYEKSKTLYHLVGFSRDEDDITAIWGSILTQGLKAGGTVEFESENRPAIWFFVEKRMRGRIAQGMMFQDFLLFSIRKKAIPRHTVHWDNVAESWASHAFYTFRECIPPSYIRLSGIYKVKYSKPPIFANTACV